MMYEVIEQNVTSTEIEWKFYLGLDCQWIHIVAEEALLKQNSVSGLKTA